MKTWAAIPSFPRSAGAVRSAAVGAAGLVEHAVEGLPRAQQVDPALGGPRSVGLRREGALGGAGGAGRGLRGWRAVLGQLFR